MIFNASNIDLGHFDVVLAHYDPKWIHAEAVEVTAENIGRLSLEFEEELYNDGRGLWFGFDAARSLEDGSPDAPNELYVPVGSWIVALRGELHVFPDNVFRNTFRIDRRDENTPPNAEDQRLTDIGRKTIGDPVTPRTAEAGGPFKPIISAEEWEQIRKDEREQIRKDEREIQETVNTEMTKTNELGGNTEAGAQGVLDVEETKVIPAVEQPLTDREKEILANSPELRPGIETMDSWRAANSFEPGETQD